MGVLESLNSYNKLLNTEYLITIGRKGKANVLCLFFDKFRTFQNKVAFSSLLKRQQMQSFEFQSVTVLLLT